MSETAFAAAFAAATALVRTTPVLHAFAPWPEDAPAASLPAQHAPAAEIVAAHDLPATPATAPLSEAVKRVAPHANWQQTYTVEEVGADFLNRYGWFELVGPTGHHHAEGVRAYIAYWGAGLTYDWHLHEAEELYFILAGEARFEAEGLPAQVLRAGDSRFHASSQPHAMQTEESGVLTLVLWRGGGLTDPARMGRA